MEAKRNRRATDIAKEKKADRRNRNIAHHCSKLSAEAAKKTGSQVKHNFRSKYPPARWMRLRRSKRHRQLLWQKREEVFRNSRGMEVGAKAEAMAKELPESESEMDLEDRDLYR